MEKTEKLPTWFGEISRTDYNDARFIPMLNTVYKNGDRYFFDGPIAVLLAQRKTPRFIEIAVDMANQIALAHLRFSSKKAGHKLNDLYSAFQIESAALLWNEAPAAVSGFGGEDIRLFVNPCPDLTQYPINSGSNHALLLRYEDGRFQVRIDGRFAHEIAEVA